MPEGDNVHAHAAALAALVGEPLIGVWSRGVEMRGLRGRALARAEAVGKHLLLAFDEGSAVRVHLGIAGWWRFVARRGAGDDRRGRTWRWRPPAASGSAARARSSGRGRGSSAARARWPPRTGSPRRGARSRRHVARARRPEHAARPIGELLLDQTIAAGLGNVYKCELLFLARPPSVAAGRRPRRRELARALRRRHQVAARQRRPRRAPPPPTSRGQRPARGRGRLWVYGRGRRACYRCGTPIAERRQRPSLRPTCWCPRCQPETRSGASAS